MNKALISLHIPKTAGSTFDYVLRKKYKKNRSIDCSLLDKLSINKRNSIELVKGHLYYGIHQDLEQECFYVAFVRDPVERAISLYKQIYQSPKSEKGKYVRENNLSLKDLILSKSSYANGFFNNQTKRIAGVSSTGEKCEENNDEPTLELALKNIENDFAFVGITELFDESLLFLKDELGWRTDPYYVTLNASREKKIEVSLDVDDEAIEVIRECNKLDAILYEHCRTVFQRKLEGKSSFMEERVRRFRYKNACYQRLVKNPYLMLESTKTILSKSKHRLIDMIK